MARTQGRRPPRIAGPPPGTAIGLVLALILEVARQWLGYSAIDQSLDRRTAAFGLYSAQGNANLSRVPQRLRRVRCGFGLADLPGFAASFSSLIPN